jgi:hypothetical protein
VALNKFTAKLLLHSGAVVFLLPLGLSAPAIAHAEATQATSGPKLPARSVVTTTYEQVRNPEAPTLWTLEHLSLQGRSLLLTLAAVQPRDSLGLSVVVVDPPPQALLTRAMVGSQTAGANHPLVDLPSATIGTTAGSTVGTQPMTSAGLSSSASPEKQTSPQITLYLKSTSIRLSDLEGAQTDIINQLPKCGTGTRRAIAFIQPEAIQKRLNISPSRAREWSQFGRAACLEWTGLPESQVKTLPQTATQPL